MKRINREVVIYTLMILAQIFVFLYWSGCKTNYHIDELYSMGYASNYTGYGNKGNYITINKADFGFNEWLNVSRLKEHLVVSREESVLKMPAFSLVKCIFTDKNFFILLNIVYTVAGLDHISAIPGFVLNIVLFITTELLLVRFMKKLDMDEWIRYLYIAMFGFSGYMISTVEYIRFYMFVIMLCVAILNLLYELWNENKWKNIIIIQLSTLLLTFLSFRNSEFTIPLFASLMGCFMIASAIRKKKKQLITCLAVCLCGLIYIMITQDFISILLNPGSYAASDSYLSAGRAIHNANIGTIMIYAGWLKGLFETSYFGVKSMILVLIAVLTIAFLVSPQADEDRKSRIEFGRIKSKTLVALVIWCGLYGICSISGHGRLICITVMLFILLMCIKDIFGDEFKFKRRPFSSDTVFMTIVACSSIALAFFEFLCEFAIWRYYCFVFTLATIVFWYIMDRLLKTALFRGSKTLMTVALAVFVLVNATVPFVTRNIENMYEDEKVFVADIKHNEGVDTVLVVSVDDGKISRHETYDCINILSDGSKIFVVDVANYDPSLADYPNNFMVWTHSERDISNVLWDIEQRGYNICEVGTDHCSRVYMCERQV